MITVKSSGGDLSWEGGPSHKGRARCGARVWGTGNIPAFDLGGRDIDIHCIVICTTVYVYHSVKKGAHRTRPRTSEGSRDFLPDLRVPLGCSHWVLSLSTQGGLTSRPAPFQVVGE